MKFMNKISWLLNVVLLGLMVYQTRTASDRARDELPSLMTQVAVVGEPKPELAGATAFPSRGAAAKTRAFQWNELESTDYRVYIANLRRIGCPEQTIRDIITADLAGAAVGLRTDRKPARGAAAKINPALDAADRAVLADLLDVPVSSEQSLATAVVAEASPERAQRRNNRRGKIAMPLVFENVDPVVLNLNGPQIAAIENLRQQFVDSIGGSDQNPNDPTYRDRWLKAQPEADGLLWWTLGSSGYQRYQMEAYAKRQSSGLPSQ